MKPDAILTADWHIQESKPRCRTDNFKAALANKIRWTLDHANENDCPIILAGDFGEKKLYGETSF